MPWPRRRWRAAPLLAAAGFAAIFTEGTGIIEGRAMIINVLLTMMIAVCGDDAQPQPVRVIVLFGLYSFLMATVMVALDAVDVAMTEAAVGAGISTVLLLGALHLCRSEEAKPAHKPWLPLLVSIAVPAWCWSTARWDLPAFSDPEAPIHTHVAPRYLERRAA
jgi:multicomponent Na+:H+ antiporter subunit B